MNDQDQFVLTGKPQPEPVAQHALKKSPNGPKTGEKARKNSKHAVRARLEEVEDFIFSECTLFLLRYLVYLGVRVFAEPLFEVEPRIFSIIILFASGSALSYQDAD